MFEGLFQPRHLLVIFVVALLVFGPKRLPDLGKPLGESIREFKKVLNGDEADSAKLSEAPKEETKNEIKQ